MRLNAPTKQVFWISVVVAIIAAIGGTGLVPQIAPYGVWIALIAYLLLVAGNTMKGI